VTGPFPGSRATGAPASSPAIFFLSDYGTVDEFVGVVHAVLHRLAPATTVIDLSHHVAPFDIGAGADLLERSAPHLGPGVVVAVVDPGVGTDRRAVALGLAGPGPTWLVGPDNGLLIPGARTLGGVVRAIELRAGIHRTSGAAGATFDGRDVFAPAAAHLVTGGDPAGLGPDIDPAGLVAAVPVGHPATDPVWAPDGSGVMAPVGWIDAFGNAQLVLAPDALARLGLVPGGPARVRVRSGAGPADTPGAPVPARWVEARWVEARWVEAYAQLAPGELGLLTDANGRVALVLNRASAAAALLIAGPGTEVEVAR
jgi:S-adenosylmethionine hydrolase